jgi:hypothetical protein
MRTGAATCGLGAGFLAGAARCGEGAGRGVGTAACAAAGAGDAAAAFAAGSGVMMLTGGMDAEVGNSAFVGLPVGTDGGIAAMPGTAETAAAAAAAGAAAGVLHAVA